MCAFLGCSLFTNVGKVKGVRTPYVLHRSLISDQVKMPHMLVTSYQQPDPQVTDIAYQFNCVVEIENIVSLFSFSLLMCVMLVNLFYCGLS